MLADVPGPKTTAYIPEREVDQCLCGISIFKGEYCRNCQKVFDATKLTDRELRIKLGAALGLDIMTWGKVHEVYYHDGKRCDLIVPQYCTDLNACHEAEKSLTGGAHANFTFWLCRVVDGQSLNDYISAPARKRAEALYISLQP